LLVDGIIGSVGSVLSFFPMLVIFFAVLAVLEDVGYMARAAYVMDRFMHLMGLHGKSFLPLFLGFGCNVPAVMGCRVIESKRARLLTILLSPLVPCSGRMAAIAFLTPAFFASPTIVSWVLIVVNLAVLALLGLALNKLVLRGERVAFIMELPLYHLPNWRTIGLTVWQRLLSFVQKAATVILLASIITWALSTLPTGNVETSWLAAFGRGLEPIGRWMGLDWRMMVALLSGFVAKENVVATLGVLFGVGEDGAGLTSLLHNVLSPAAGLAFLVVQMLFIPCVGTVGAIRQETSSWRWTVFSILLLLFISLLGGMLAYQTVNWLIP
jgi:ferrous iron transport protein B